MGGVLFGEEMPRWRSCTPWRSAWSKDNTGRDSINNPEEEVVAKVSMASSTDVRTQWDTWSVKKDCWYDQERPTSVRHSQGQVWSRRHRQGQRQEQRRQGPAGVLQVRQDCTHEERLPQRHKDGHHIASVTEEEPEKEVGGLTSFCAVEHMGKHDMKEICAVEEIRRIKICVEFGAAASVWPRDLCKDYPHEELGKSQARSARLRARTAIRLSIKGNGSST